MITRNPNQTGNTTPTTLPQATEIFMSLAGGMDARRALAARLVTALETQTGGRAAVFEDRQDGAGTTSLLLAGGKPEKSSAPRGAWSLTLCGAAGVDGAVSAWRATLRLTISGKECAACAAELEELAEECRAESEQRVATGQIMLTAPTSELVQMGMVVGGPASAGVIRSIMLYAKERLPVLVSGENGTGKERIAQALHEQSGRTGKIVTLNCGCIPRELIADDLFGHERGAFTGAPTARKGAFEEADGGTLFLDEIGEMPAEQQVALLRTLQEGTIRRIGAAEERAVNVRVIAATNCDLEQMVADGRFRRDLYYRLCVLKIEVTPLRERRDEIPALVRHLVAKMAAEHGGHLSITAAALRALASLQWLGNVRELVNVLDRGRIHAESGQITTDALGLGADVGTGCESEVFVELAAAAPVGVSGTTYAQAMAVFEARLVTAALTTRGFNVKETAEELGISLSTLHRRMRDLGIKRPQPEPAATTEGAALTGPARVHTLSSLRMPEHGGAQAVAA